MSIDEKALEAAIAWYWRAGAISENIPRGCIREYLANLPKAAKAPVMGASAACATAADAAGSATRKDAGPEASATHQPDTKSKIALGLKDAIAGRWKSTRFVVHNGEVGLVADQPDESPYRLDADMFLQSYLDSHDWPHDFDAVTDVLHEYKLALRAPKREAAQPVGASASVLDEVVRIYDSAYNIARAMNLNLLSLTQRREVWHREALNAIWSDAYNRGLEVEPLKQEAAQPDESPYDFSIKAGAYAGKDKYRCKGIDEATPKRESSDELEKFKFIAETFMRAGDARTIGGVKKMILAACESEKQQRRGPDA